MNDSAIEIRDLGKCYNIYERPRDRLLQMLYRRRRQLYRQFWALRDVSFDVPRGETIGIVGRNGSGKSTLLQMIAGTLTPSTGSVQANGRIAALLELGSGFNPEFTGRENVFLNGALLGLSQAEIEERFDSIVEFADIGQFVDQPVKTYSSGMMVRLAFAVQAQTDPEILIVDEALAVGDARFQAKCFDRLKQLKNNGTSILLVSHSSEQIVTHCSHALLLDGGQMLMAGNPRDVVNRYLDLLFGRKPVEASAPQQVEAAGKAPEADVAPDEMSDESVAHVAHELDFVNDRFVTRPGYNQYEYRWGDGSASISDFRIVSDDVEYPNSIEPGALVTLTVAVTFKKRLIRPILGVTIKTKEGVTLFGSNSELLNLDDARSVGEPGDQALATMRFRCNLGAGDFFVSLGIATREAGEIVPHDRRYDAIHLVVSPDPTYFGLANMNLEMRLDKIQ
ncbi:MULTISPECIES: ABC transporter ATP-binding protein [unclassified Caballeronia]|uniref:ABC transporter ATP-binding protein n=1 Tax=unclassified Caballeronia TaxID=2646786 RepID=UPI001F1EA62C|nr:MULTISPECIES: ABC transporter ATP-binding protein [unclassified Caballeronia]MCE4540909.1 ABC transporter ATP-binding protein [Caballeronia sp. PC1]MCE4570048.1 ABC transporter ATP-binding protein [Caballeronia sp. CLC5]